MAIKKSELYSSLWKSCDELRGGMDASQYKDYVLVLLFVKYVSDKYAGQKDALLDVPKGGGFFDMVALKGDKEIGDKINKIIGKLAEANDLKGVIDVADFNDADKLGKGKEMVDRLSNLVSIFNTPALDFQGNRAEGDDILGDAYEYLMRHFATESGKSKGQFYTPAEVSRIMAKVIGVGSAKNTNQTIHDPACGSGSLLIKAHDEAKNQAGLDLAIYGQEMDNATFALANMNAILHDCPTREIWRDNTLSTPHFKTGDGILKTFDFVVANPPFSTKAWSNGFNPAEDEFKRFEYGIPPAKNGDYAFLLHILATLKSTGKGAVILPHGVLFRGNAEAEIRRNIVRRGYIKGIIGLPANLFYGTGIPACIIVLDKENASARKGIFMINASKGFLKDGSKNRLRAQDIHKIVDVFTRQLEIARYSRLVPLAEIESNDFNLNLPRYIDSTEPEDLQDIDAHLRGGIPERDLDALGNYWKIMPGLRASLLAKFIPPEVTLPAGMYPAYAETHFCCPDALTGCPDEIAIITAHATTGEKWTDAQNAAADVELENLLRGKGEWVHRLTGYSPTTLHAEPGWTAALSFEAACDIGSRFKQDAIYFVRGGTLFVSHCDRRRKLIEIGPFLPRLLVSAGMPSVRPGYCQLRLPIAEVKPAIFGHAEFTTFNQSVTVLFEKWKKANTPRLKAIAVGSHPKALIETLSEDLLETFRQARLLDPYDVYQHLMSYWAETMQDDVYMIVSDGWKAVVDGKPNTDLIPEPLIVRCYFAVEQRAIEKLEAERDAITRQMEELDEEHGGEDGPLFEAKTEKGKLTKVSVNARLKEIKHEKEAADELKALEACLAFIEKESTADKHVKDAQKALETRVAAKYPKLTDAEIKTLVVDDKWLATLSAAVQSELDRVSQALTGRIKQLADRYATPLPKLTGEVETLAARVDEHLKKMGAVWN